MKTTVDIFINDVCNEINCISCVEIKVFKEYKFLENRKFRFDYVLFIYYLKSKNETDVKKIAVEIEGGAWIFGRHNRPKTFLKDIEKYNLATQEGFYLLRYTPQSIYEKFFDDLINFIKKNIDNSGLV
ncbi:MAG: hypothetical protein SNJ64_03075 [Endomicrobiia bacterium]